MMPSTFAAASVGGARHQHSQIVQQSTPNPPAAGTLTKPAQRHKVSADPRLIAPWRHSDKENLIQGRQTDNGLKIGKPLLVPRVLMARNQVLPQTPGKPAVATPLRQRQVLLPAKGVDSPTGKRADRGVEQSEIPGGSRATKRRQTLILDDRAIFPGSARPGGTASTAESQGSTPGAEQACHAPIDFDKHVFGFEINKACELVGGHSTSTGEVEVESVLKYDSKGVEYALVSPRSFKKHPLTGEKLTKSSTLFPRNWSVEKVKEEVNHAFSKKEVKGDKWSGVTKSGIMVKGYLRPHVTVYPKIEKR